MKAELEDYLSYEKLRDGREIVVRAVHPDDREMLLDIWDHLSAQSRYYRFFSPKQSLTDQELAYYTNIDFKTHVALLAILMEGERENAIGVGRYIVIDHRDEAEASQDVDTAEVASTVEDQFHGLGIATILLKHLSEIGRERGVKAFSAYVLDENEKMLEVFENCGLAMTSRQDEPGTRLVKLELAAVAG